MARTVWKCLAAWVLLTASLAWGDDASHIHVLMSGGYTGQAVHVDAVGIPLKAGSDVTAFYDWDFGDPGSPFNRLSGWNAAHLYESPGSYTITLTITDQAGEKQVLRALIDVQSVHRTTYYFAHDGSDRNSGLEPDRPLKSVSRITKLVADHTRFLFKDGDTFDVTGSLSVQAKDVSFGSYVELTDAMVRPPPGRDVRPRLVWAGAAREDRMIHISKISADVTIRNLVFDTVFNANNDSRNLPGALECDGTNIAVINCRFLNVATAVNCENGPTGVLVQQSDAPQVTRGGMVLPAGESDVKSADVTGLRAYFVWVEGENIVIIGNTVANPTREHCVRISHGRVVLVEDNDLQNLDREGVDKQDIAKATVAAQIGDHVWIGHNILRGGATGVGPLPRADWANDPAQRKARFDSIMWDGNTITSPLLVDPGSSNVMIRNNICKRDNWGAFIINGYDKNFDRDAANVWILHNTVINNGPKGNFLDINGRAEHVTVAGNLYIAPNLQVNWANSPVMIAEKQLTSFDGIHDNVWPRLAGHPGTGGVMLVGGVLKSPADWSSMENVSGDRFIPVELGQFNQPAQTVGVPAILGAWQAMDGSERGTGDSPAGAMGSR